MGGSAITVHRKHRRFQLTRFRVSIDGELAGTLEPGEELTSPVADGEHVVHVRGGSVWLPYVQESTLRVSVPPSMTIEAHGIAAGSANGSLSLSILGQEQRGSSRLASWPIVWQLLALAALACFVWGMGRVSGNEDPKKTTETTSFEDPCELIPGLPECDTPIP